MCAKFTRVIVVVAALGYLTGASAQSLAQEGSGQDNGSTAAAGVGKAGQPVILRPTGRISGQYIVVFRDEVTNPRGLANALARRNGFTLRGVYTTALKGFAARMPEAMAERLLLDPNIASVEQDVYVNADDLVTGVDRVDAELNMTAGIDGLGGAVDVDVAVIDTGIYPHADLNWSNARFYDCRGGCFATLAFDDNGHGTHVAGSIAALDDGANVGTTEVVGVAPGARIWGFKVLNSGGSGSLADVISAVDMVTALGVIEVANMSLSAQAYVAAFRTAIQNSVNSGVVHVVAAGNALRDVYGADGLLDTADRCTGPFCFNLGDDTIPASYPEAMAASAMADFDGTGGGLTDQTIAFSSCTHTGDDVLACFTNYSQSVHPSNPVVSPGAAIDVAGPGVSILSTWNNGGYNSISGTSMASPHVAGAVALCIVEDCGMLGRPPANAADVAAIRQAVIDGSQPQSAWGPVSTKDPDGNAEGLVYLGGAAGPIHDVAVTSVTAPSPVLVNSTHTVSVDVANTGTETETITVSLNDDFSATISAGQTVTLSAGEGASLDFSWTPTVIGNHRLTGSHDLIDDNGANDAAETVVSVSDPITDAAVTSIDAPSPVEVSTVQTVMVGVANNSTQQETFTVSLADSLSASVSGDQTVTLDSGAGTTVSFSWTPTASGDHLLTANASLTGDGDSSNDSMQTTSTVTEPGSSTLVVESVCYSGSGGRQSNKHLNSVVTVTDGTTPLSGATVSARVEDSSGGSRSGTGTTDTAGEVQFSWKNADFNETYTTVVESVNGDPNIATPANSAMWDEDNGTCF